MLHKILFVIGLVFLCLDFYSFFVNLSGNNLCEEKGNTLSFMILIIFIAAAISKYIGW